jgi:hypothetical protein
VEQVQEPCIRGKALAFGVAFGREARGGSGIVALGGADIVGLLDGGAYEG